MSRTDPDDLAAAHALIQLHAPDLARRLADREAMSEMADLVDALRELVSTLEDRANREDRWREDFVLAYDKRREAELREHDADLKAVHDSKRVDAITAIRDVMRGPSGVVIAGLAASIGLSLIVLSLAVLVVRLDDVGVSISGAGISMEVGRVHAEKINAARTDGASELDPGPGTDAWSWTAPPEPTE